ncbi:uncharacterized protein LOC125227598 [Leguminivora glycinivorella]|uniref:uncharacterized protein LOC125227598 n=1 Tax=Leguminivora glycinivorella TaxID=1035111 RepID=UPI00200C760E|nr:uncharacterized protein LOC125227598 [Leguminivora glycinivorella]
MSLIARSLTALVALLAAAHAQSNCQTVLFGLATSNPITFMPTQYTSGGARLYVDNECQKQQGRLLAGELITACGITAYGATPGISQANAPHLSPIDVTCADGCPGGGVAKIIQYCY